MGHAEFGDQLEELNIGRKPIQHDRKWTYNVRSRRVRETIVALENSISITYSECLSLALATQHSKHNVPYYIFIYISNKMQR